MITLYRWYLLKAKKIKLALAFYDILEESAASVMEMVNSIDKDSIQNLLNILRQTAGNANTE